MGTTISSIHIYTDNQIPASLGCFRSFSDGWQTLVPKYGEDIDYDDHRKLARKLSRQVSCPVLWFRELDSDEFGFIIFHQGKQITVFGTDFYDNKGIFKAPPLIGYSSGNKQRLSMILYCADIDSTIAMLEEYFGVCLEVTADLVSEYPEQLRRIRSDALYREYLNKQKQLTGKKAPISVELTEEIFGMLEFNGSFSDHSQPRKHIFYIAQFRSILELKKNWTLPSVEFREGKLEPADKTIISRAGLKPNILGDDPRFKVEFYPFTVTFTHKAPPAYRGKVFRQFPRGYYPYDFDQRDHLILSNERNGVAFMDSEGKVIAKCSLKGYLTDYRDGYFLTDKTGPFQPYGWGFNPDGLLRIYRIIYKDSQSE
ncbi:MAG: hypothetical protein K6A14_03315 [Erysipelotrichaceae bacterium]|nr:hypothetical protein [Erysipelotrichaceae bacterium]